MGAQTQTWHYGLVARYWAEHNTGGPEIDYYRRHIERIGEPALDAGCGAGRLLIPFLQAGLDVDGCDVSTDMLALARERAEREGLKPNLYAQALHQLDLPRSYQTIVACGVFGLGGSRAQDFAGLQRLHLHLKPGGVLLLDSYLPYGEDKAWRFWQKEPRKALPEAWPEDLGKLPPQDGSEYLILSRTTAFDPLEQQITREMRTLRWRDGQVIEQVDYPLVENFYFYHELITLLERAGFIVEAVQGDFTEAAASVDHEVLTYIARKPA